ncbi:MAG: translation initiation factor 1 [Polaribacter sp.]|jgi:translation initiation factor 1
MSKKNNKRTFYSTNPDFVFNDEEEEQIVNSPYSKQKIYVSIDRKKRRGKEVTLVEGFKGTMDQMKAVAKMLKSKCGVGGSAKDGEIIIQGSHRDKVIELLKKEGFGKVISKGG